MIHRQEGTSPLRDATARLIQQDIVKADLSAKALVQDIRECCGPVDSLNALNARVSEAMRAMKRGIEELEALAREQDRESERSELLSEAERQRKNHAANQFQLRKANLSCQALLDRQCREELLKGEEDVPRRRIRADKEGLARQSSAITASLVAVAGAVAAQVKQSEESLHTLVGSSGVVSETHDEFKGMAAVIHQTKSLLHKYGRREVTDRILIALAMVFFLACVMYIVQKRLF